MNGNLNKTLALKIIYTLGILILIQTGLFAQNSFENELFSAKLALKNRIEIGLSNDQIASIQEIYTTHITEFEIMRFELDAQLIELDKIMKVTEVDEERATVQLQKVLRLEEQLKRIRLLMLIRIKNTLSSDQQAKLKNLRTEGDVDSFLMKAPVSNNQSVIFQLKDIQGNGTEPLFIVKTKNREREVSQAYVQTLSMSDIQSINIIIDAAAVEKYGSKGKNGIVYIELK